jgi:hypothetical protein
MSYSFLVHSSSSSQVEMLQSIYRDGCLRAPDTIEEEYDDIQPKPYVYTHYLFSDIDYKPGSRSQINYNSNKNNVSFWIDPIILKDLPYYVCESTMYGLCMDYKEALIMKGKGKLTRQPSMKKLEDHINERLRSERNKKKYNGLMDYTLSHEVLIKKIPLRYVFAIVVKNEKIQKRVQSIFTTIPVICQNIDVPTYDKRIRKVLDQLE